MFPSAIERLCLFFSNIRLSDWSSKEGSKKVIEGISSSSILRRKAGMVADRKRHEALFSVRYFAVATVRPNECVPKGERGAHYRGNAYLN